jgi:hypothetical protein
VSLVSSFDGEGTSSAFALFLIENTNDEQAKREIGERLTSPILVQIQGLLGEWG